MVAGGAGALIAALHGRYPPGPGEVWSAWNWDPWILLGLFTVTIVYLRGVRTLWSRSGRGTVVSPRRVAAFLGGIYALFVALVSPVDAMGGALFSAHMVQHLLLMLVAGPLLAFGAPLVPMLWALPKPWRIRLGRGWRRVGGRGLWKCLSHPLAVWLLYAAALWIWHLPGPYQAALENDLLHALEHASFLGAATLFWWLLLHARARRARVYGVAVLFVFATMVQSGVLAAMITLARAPWYPAHAEGAALWDLPLLEDQRLAGVLMWVPPAVLYIATALVLFAAWLRAIERRVERSESQGGLQPRRRSQIT